MLGLALLVMAVFIVFFNDIQFISFDEEFALAGGANVKFIKYLLIILVALTSVLYIKVAGIILVLSLLTIPQNMALLFTRRLRWIIFLSIIFGMIGSFSGLFISYFLDIPSGASIIFSLVILYVIAYAFQRIRLSLNRNS